MSWKVCIFKKINIDLEAFMNDVLNGLSNIPDII